MLNPQCGAIARRLKVPLCVTETLDDRRRINGAAMSGHAAFRSNTKRRKSYPLRLLERELGPAPRVRPQRRSREGGNPWQAYVSEANLADMDAGIRGHDAHSGVHARPADHRWISARTFASQ